MKNISISLLQNNLIQKEVKFKFHQIFLVKSFYTYITVTCHF